MTRAAARWRHAGPTAGLIAHVLIFHGAVRCFGLGRVQRWASRRIPARPRPGAEDEIVAAARLRVRFVKRRVPRILAGNCLSRSLALWWTLARSGVPTSLCIGADRHAGTFRAHAWVEHQGVPLNAGRRVHRRFAAFDRNFAPTVHG
ncbi:MAG: lasso peptide biosynthesis B2 protein [Sphingomonas sp.]